MKRQPTWREKAIITPFLTAPPPPSYRLPPPAHTFDPARNRYNNAVFVELECIKTTTTFGVATYHMPCQFRVPKVMVIHASLFTSWAQELAKGRSLVLCGDFNFQPVSEDHDDKPRAFIIPRHHSSTHQLPTNPRATRPIGW